MLDGRYFAIGDWFTCEYNGKPRLAEVVEIHEDLVLVSTADGYRKFKYNKIRKFVTTHLCEDGKLIPAN